MTIFNIIVRCIVLLMAIAFCGASVSKDTTTLDSKALYGVLSCLCIFFALTMGVS